MQVQDTIAKYRLLGLVGQVAVTELTAPMVEQQDAVFAQVLPAQFEKARVVLQRAGPLRMVEVGEDEVVPSASPPEELFGVTVDQAQ